MSKFYILSVILHGIAIFFLFGFTKDEEIKFKEKNTVAVSVKNRRAVSDNTDISSIKESEKKEETVVSQEKIVEKEVMKEERKEIEKKEVITKKGQKLKNRRKKNKRVPRQKKSIMNLKIKIDFCRERMVYLLRLLKTE